MNIFLCQCFWTEKPHKMSHSNRQKKIEPNIQLFQIGKSQSPRKYIHTIYSPHILIAHIQYQGPRVPGGVIYFYSSQSSISNIKYQGPRVPESILHFSLPKDISHN